MRIGAQYLLAVRERFCFLHFGPQGGQLLSPEACRLKAEEAEELARTSTDVGAQQAYEKIGQLWREMAQRAERNKW
jgi:hypothetical protein